MTSFSTIRIKSGILNKGDEIIITGPTTGIVHAKAEKIIKNNEQLEHAKKDDIITIEIKEKIRKNDKLYLIKEK